MRVPIILLILLIACTCCQKDSGPNPGQAATFIKFYGGFNSEKAYSALQTPDGGFLCIGTTNSLGNGGNDMYLIKTDAFGNKEWEQTYGGKADEEGKSIQLMPDGNYLLLGEYTQEDNTSDLYLICLQPDGKEIWSKTFGSTSQNEKAFALTITHNQEILIIGNILNPDASTDMFLIRTDIHGRVQWEKEYGLTGLQDELMAVRETHQGNLVWCGSEHRVRNNDNNAANMRVVLTRPEGDLLWDKNIGEQNIHFGSDIELTDNGFIVLGNTATDIYLVSLFDDGTQRWMAALKKERTIETGNSIAPTNDGGFIIAGSIEQTADNSDIYLVRTDKKGNEIWAKNFGGKLNDSGIVARQTTDGGFMVFGTVTFENNTMLCLIKTDAKGELSGK